MTLTGRYGKVPSRRDKKYKGRLIAGKNDFDIVWPAPLQKSCLIRWRWSAGLLVVVLSVTPTEYPRWTDGWSRNLKTVCFTLAYFSFILYLIINKNTEKGMYLVIQERFSSNIWYVTTFCEYPVSLKLLLNILYPYKFFLKYPVSR